MALASHSLPTKCTPWFTSIIEPYRCGFISAFHNHSTIVVLLYWLSLSSTLLGVDSLQAMSFSSRTWLRVSISIYYPREYRLRSRRWSIPFESSYPVGGLPPLTLGYEKVIFHSEHLLELLDQEDRVMKCDTSRVMKHNPILQGDMPPMHERKSRMGDWKVFFLPGLPISSFLYNWCILRRFLCSPPFINLETRFLLRGGYNTPCYSFINHLH
jgi:hypothetical protein